MRERVVGSESRESQRLGDGLVQPTRVAQRSDQSMVCVDLRWIGCDGRSEGLSRSGWVAARKQFEATLEQGSGGCVVVHG